MVASLVGGAAFVGGLLTAPVDFAEAPVARSALLLDSQGRLVATIRPPQQRVPVTTAQIPDVVRAAVIAAEDADYYSHRGVDPSALARAGWKDLTGSGALQGGSTITQQYVKNVFLTSSRTPLRKVREAALALRLERRLSKDEILTRYLNDVYFGNGAYGVQAASRYYFGRDVGQLDLARASLLAGIIPAPSLWNPQRDLEQARRRQLYTLNRMVAAGMLTPQQASDAYTEQVPVVGAGPDEQVDATVAPEFRDLVLAQVRQRLADLEPASAAAAAAGTGDDADPLYQSGLRVTTTLDLDLQRSVVEAVGQVLDQPDDPEAAVVALDPRTGDIKAMTTRFDAQVGGNRVQGYQTGGFNLATRATRSSGSLIKSFTLAAALQHGDQLTDTRDAPYCASIPNPGGIPDPYKPCNASRSETGTYTLAEALVKSVNTVYVPLAVDTGLDTVMRLAGAAGFAPQQNLDAGHLSSALGVEITPLSAAAGYATLVDHGVAHPPRSLLAIRAAGDTNGDGDLVWTDEADPAGAAVMPAAVADQVTGVLQDVVDRGTATAARQAYPLYGKTGTNGTSDAWFVGCTRSLCVAVWVGYDDHRSMAGVHGFSNVDGGTIPALIVSRTLQGYAATSPGAQAALVGDQPSPTDQRSARPTAPATRTAPTRPRPPRVTTGPAKPAPSPPDGRPSAGPPTASGAPTGTVSPGPGNGGPSAPPRPSSPATAPSATSPPKASSTPRASLTPRASPTPRASATPRASPTPRASASPSSPVRSSPSAPQRTPGPPAGQPAR